jgi:hypothetical protein
LGSDGVPTSLSQEVSADGTLAAEEPVAEEPVAAEPAVEEQVVEEQVVEEPVVEEQVVAEEPVVEEQVAEEPVVEEQVAEEPVVEEQVAEEPVVEEPAAEEPVVDEPVAEEPVVEEPAAEEPVVDEPVAEELSVEERLERDGYRICASEPREAEKELTNRQEPVAEEMIGIPIREFDYINKLRHTKRRIGKRTWAAAQSLKSLEVSESSSRMSKYKRGDKRTINTFVQN